MAAQQKRELEETELKVPDSIPLCSESSDLKIYKQDEPPPPPPPQPHQISSFVSNAKLTDRESVALRSPAVASSDLKMCKQDPSRLSSVSSTVTNNDLMTMNKKRKREVNRCSRTDCCKRVGLIPFRWKVLMEGQLEALCESNDLHEVICGMGEAFTKPHYPIFPIIPDDSSNFPLPGLPRHEPSVLSLKAWGLGGVQCRLMMFLLGGSIANSQVLVFHSFSIKYAEARMRGGALE
ncbi:hypothetical protein BC332_16910 [Capsicum chinense]|nr:hypothetical protein BC332_16910 [Capsicum chinense]